MQSVGVSGQTKPSRIPASVLLAKQSVHLDFETFSKIDVRKVGAYRYARHPSTEVLILAYRLPGAPMRYWLPTWPRRMVPMLPEDIRDNCSVGHNVPLDLQQAVEDDSLLFEAHNAEFEMNIWEQVVVPVHGGKPIPLKRWRCTAAKAATAGLPRSLAKLAVALHLGEQKDSEGTRLINIFSKPRKPTKLNKSTRVFPHQRPEDFIKFIQYCGQDVRTEHMASLYMPDLIPSEWAAYRHTVTMNMRGLPLDMAAVRNGYRMLLELEADVSARVRAITGGINATQRDKMLGFLNGLGVEIEDLQAKTIKDIVLKRKDDLSPEALELLQLRVEGGKASTKKLSKMIEVVGEDGIVRGGFLFYGAGTGRLAGKLVQPHNFIRGEYKPYQLYALFELIHIGDVENIKLIYEWPIDAMAQGMRGYIAARPGNKFVVVDFAAIEARVLVWLARQEDALAAYHKNTDMYKWFAVRLYGLKSEDEVTVPQRKFAKDLWLGCLAADTKVLTGRGWVQIVGVTDKDVVWDGIEWVPTHGVQFMGNKEVIDLCGVRLTADHKIWCGQQWATADKLTPHSQYLQSALSAATLPSQHTGSESAATTHPRTAGSSPSKKTFGTKVDVYDLIECGPRNRFTILTDRGPVIAHNCGYQLGETGFINNALKRGIIVDQADAKKGVRGYRDLNPKVVELWAEVETAAIRAVTSCASRTKPVKLRNLSFFVEGIWFCIQLPSGRCLWYPYPRVESTVRFGRPVKKLTYRSEVKGKWIREGTYGGKIVENIVQAIARDFMQYACFTVEREGYEVIGTVHDELVTEVPETFGNPHELEKLVCRKPKWATDAPIGAEAWEGKRYRK